MELKRQVCLYRRCDIGCYWEYGGFDHMNGPEPHCSVCGCHLRTSRVDEYERCDLRLYYIRSRRSWVRMWIREWAHTWCITDLYSRWAGRADMYIRGLSLAKCSFTKYSFNEYSVLSLSVVEEWDIWKNWLCARAEREWYTTHGPVPTQFTDNVDRLYGELSAFNQVKPLHREKRGACALLCLQECGLPWDIAWPIAAIAYWLV